MKQLLSLSLLVLMLAGCGTSPTAQAPVTTAAAETLSAQDVNLVKSQIKGVIKLYFRYLDDNKDGKVSKKELAKNAPGPFLMRPYFDKNKDGYLSEEELLQMMGTTVQFAAELLYTAFDTNFDGKVTRETSGIFRSPSTSSTRRTATRTAWSPWRSSSASSPASA